MSKPTQAELLEQARQIVGDIETAEILRDAINNEEVPSAKWRLPDSDSTLNELFDKWTVLKAEKNDLEQRLDEVDAKLNPLEEQIVELMGSLNYQSIKHNDVLHWLSVVARPSVKPDKRSAFIDYLKRENEDGIVQTDYINSNTLWGWYNQRDDATKEILTQYIEAPEKIYLNSPKAYVRKRKKR